MNDVKQALTWSEALEQLAAGRRVRVLRAEGSPNGWSTGQYLEQVDGKLVKHYQDGTEARGYVTPIWLEEGQWEVFEQPAGMSWPQAELAIQGGAQVRRKAWATGDVVYRGRPGKMVRAYEDGEVLHDWAPSPEAKAARDWEALVLPSIEKPEKEEPPGMSWPQAEAALYRGDRVRMVDWPKGDYVQRVEPGELVFVYGDGTPTWNGWLAADAQKVGRNWELAPEPAEPPRMGWSTAEQAIVRGYRVRRASWPEGDVAYAVSPPGNMVLADSDGGVHDWAPSDEAKAARDWEYAVPSGPEAARDWKVMEGGAEQPTVPAGELEPVDGNEPPPSFTVPESELEAMHDRVLAEAEKGKEANARIEELEAKVANLKKQVVEGYDALGKEVKRREELEVERDDLRSNWHASIEEANGLRADLGAARTRIGELEEKLRHERKERAELVNEGNRERADYGSRIEKLEEERDRLKKDLATAQRDYEVQNEFREGAERERDEARKQAFHVDSPLYDQYHKMRHAILASVHVLAMDGFEGAGDSVSHILREACSSGMVKEQEEGR